MFNEGFVSRTIPTLPSRPYGGDKTYSEQLFRDHNNDWERYAKPHFKES
jgi:hypothetical protein